MCALDFNLKIYFSIRVSPRDGGLPTSARCGAQPNSVPPREAPGSAVSAIRHLQFDPAALRQTVPPCGAPASAAASCLDGGTSRKTDQPPTARDKPPANRKVSRTASTDRTVATTLLGAPPRRRNRPGAGSKPRFARFRAPPAGSAETWVPQLRAPAEPIPRFR